jgi:N-acetylglutamate synthase
MSYELIAHIDELAANGWPTLVNQGLGGWRLRYANGVSLRANSCLPNGWHGPTSLEERLAAVEQFYASRSLPACYQLCPAAQPADLDAILAARGYRSISETMVQTVDLATMLQATTSSAAVQIEPGLSEQWLDCYLLAEHGRTEQRAGRAAIFSQIGPPTAYASCWLGGTLAAVGLGVAERGWLGIFCMATLPEFRRQGAARAIIAGLGQWAQQNGASHAYLQVSVENSTAQALYTGFGFATLYRYHYRTLEF